MAPVPPAARHLLNQAGLYLQSRAQFGDARGLLERALAIDEVAYGSEHPHVATDVSNLGGVLQDLGDLPGARAALERALAIDEAVLGASHPSTVTVRANLDFLRRGE
jgi:tetratricopeptide (TPR) repeat protein